MSAPNKDFDLWMGVYVPGVVCTLGIVGNIISLCVLSCDKGNYPTFFSLKALAACDIVLLSTALWHQIIPMFCSTMKFGGDFWFDFKATGVNLNWLNDFGTEDFIARFHVR